MWQSIIMHSTSIAICTLLKVLVTQMPLYSCQTVSEAMEGGIVEDRRFEGLPEADYYLIEEMLPILPKVCSKNVHILHWKKLSGRLPESQDKFTEAQTHIPCNLDGEETEVRSPHNQTQRYRPHFQPQDWL